MWGHCWKCGWIGTQRWEEVSRGHVWDSKRWDGGSYQDYLQTGFTAQDFREAEALLANGFELTPDSITSTLGETIQAELAVFDEDE